MKRHIALLTAALAGALAIATPVNAGPLGVISAGAGGGALGALGGTLSGAGQNFGMGAVGALGTGGNFHGQLVQPDPSLERAPLRSAPGAARSVRGSAEQKAGALRDTVRSTSQSAAGETQGAVSATAANAPTAAEASAREDVFAGGSRNIGASGSARGEASMNAGSASATGSARTEARAQR